MTGGSPPITAPDGSLQSAKALPHDARIRASPFRLSEQRSETLARLRKRTKKASADFRGTRLIRNRSRAGNRDPAQCTAGPSSSRQKNSRSKFELQNEGRDFPRERHLAKLQSIAPGESLESHEKTTTSSAEHARSLPGRPCLPASVESSGHRNKEQANRSMKNCGTYAESSTQEHEDLFFKEAGHSEPSARQRIAFFLDTSRAGRMWEAIDTGLTFLWCCLYVVNTSFLLKITDDSHRRIKPMALPMSLRIADFTLAVAILLQWIPRAFISPSRLEFLLEWLSIFTLLSTVPVVCAFIVGVFFPMEPNQSYLFSYISYMSATQAFKYFYPFRWWRLQFSMNMLIAPVKDPLIRISNVLRKALHLGLGILWTLIGVASFAHIEHYKDKLNEHYDKNIDLSFYNTVFSTVMSVTNGMATDLDTREPFTKFLLLGILVAAVVFIPTNLSELLNMIGSRSKYRRPFKPNKNEQHILISGEFEAESVLEFLREFFCPDHGLSTVNTQVVIIKPEEPNERLACLLNDPAYVSRVRYVKGSVTSFKDLDKVAAGEAKACFLLGSKLSDVEANEEDAANVMRALALKRYSRGLPIFVQSLLPENLCHFESVSDHILCIDQLKLGILSQSCRVTGFATLISLLTTSFTEDARRQLAGSVEGNPGLGWTKSYLRGVSQEIYSTRLSPAFNGLKFIDAAEVIYQQTEATLFGLGIPFRTARGASCDDDSDCEFEDLNRSIFPITWDVFLNPSDFRVSGGEVAFVISTQSTIAERLENFALSDFDDSRCVVDMGDGNSDATGAAQFARAIIEAKCAGTGGGRRSGETGQRQKSLNSVLPSFLSRESTYDCSTDDDDEESVLLKKYGYHNRAKTKKLDIQSVVSTEAGEALSAMQQHVSGPSGQEDEPEVLKDLLVIKGKANHASTRKEKQYTAVGTALDSTKDAASKSETCPRECTGGGSGMSKLLVGTSREPLAGHTMLSSPFASCSSLGNPQPGAALRQSSGSQWPVTNETTREAFPKSWLGNSPTPVFMRGRDKRQVDFSSDAVWDWFDESPLPDDIHRHVLICASGSNFPRGLEHFISPLRGPHAQKQVSIVVLSNDDPPHNWGNIQKFGGVYHVKGSPMVRRDLVRARIDVAGRCVILSNSALRDKSGFSNTVDASALLVVLNVEVLAPETTFIVVEFLHRANMKFVGDYDILRTSDPIVQMIMRPSFMAGHVYAPSMLDTAMCQTYYNPYLLTILKRMVFSEKTRYHHQHPEHVPTGESREGEELGRGPNRSRQGPRGGTISPAHVYLCPIPREFQDKSYLSLHTFLTRSCKAIAIGLYRRVECSGSARFNYYPVVNPRPLLTLRAGDRVYLLAEQMPDFKSQRPR